MPVVESPCNHVIEILAFAYYHRLAVFVPSAESERGHGQRREGSILRQIGQTGQNSEDQQILRPSSVDVSTWLQIPVSAASFHCLANSSTVWWKPMRVCRLKMNLWERLKFVPLSSTFNAPSTGIQRAFSTPYE